MGASFWSTFVPISESAAAAFSLARRDVFARGEYYAGRRKKKFKSMEALVEAQAEEGTHSILDMVRVDDGAAPPRADFDALKAMLAAALSGGPTSHGVVFRMTAAELTTCFGTTRPTRAEIEAGKDRAHTLCERWTGRYTEVFASDGAPAGFWFVGVSGD